MHFYELPMNNSIEDQCISRTRRIDNPWGVVYIFKYSVSWTVAPQSVLRNIETGLPETSANLNQEIVDGEEEVGHAEIGLIH